MKFVHLFINWFIGWLFDDKQNVVVCEVALDNITVESRIYDVVESKVHINLEERAKRLKAQTNQPPQVSWKEYKRYNKIVNTYLMKGGGA